MKKLIFIIIIIIVGFSCKHSINSKPEIGNSRFVPWHYSINWGFENYSPYILGCKNSLSAYKVVFEKTVNWNDLYNYDFRLTIEGEDIPYCCKDSSGNGVIYNFGKELDRIIRKNENRKKILVKAEVIQKVYNGSTVKNIFIDKEEQYINIVKSGMKYSVFKNEGEGYPPDYNPCQLAIKSGFYKKYLFCGGKKETLIISTKKPINLKSLNNDLDIYKLNLSEYYNFTNDTINIKKEYGIYHTVNLKGGGIESNICQFPAILITFTKKVEYIYLADCNSEILDSLIEKKTTYSPLNVGFVPCTVETK